MRQVNIHEAKTNLSRLIEEAVNGEPFVIAKAGKPMVQVIAVSLESQPDPRPIEEKFVGSPKRFASERFGFMKGKIFVPDDFDTAYQDEIIRMFEGEV
ncbi:type II toxin-antitoxin system Phd/YefM family antitoxin [Rhizobium sp.]